MIIANPIYDVVFKYLLEDQEIARGLLSEIIGEEIVELDFVPREQTTRNKQFDIIVMRMDFAATVRTKTGEEKKTLIELQKSRSLNDIIRFRRYLALNYHEEPDGDGQEVLPLITIYFLGFRLKNVTVPLLKVNRQYWDMVAQGVIEAKEDFVEKLTHDCYVIQIPRLEEGRFSRLEKLLAIFDQSYAIRDRNLLTIPQEELEGYELLEAMAFRLRMAATEEEVLRDVEYEQEINATFKRHLRKQMDLELRTEELKSEAEEYKSEAEEAKSVAKEYKSEAEEAKSVAKEYKSVAKEAKSEAEEYKSEAQMFASKTKELTSSNQSLQEEILELRRQLAAK